MSTLHIVSCSPQLAEIYSSLRRLLGPDDGILLTGDGVYAGVQPETGLTAPLYALKPDVIARGLQSLWPDSIQLIDHAGYVDLCVRYDKSLNWSAA